MVWYKNLCLKNTYSLAYSSYECVISRSDRWRKNRNDERHAVRYLHPQLLQPPHAELFRPILHAGSEQPLPRCPVRLHGMRRRNRRPPLRPQAPDVRSERGGGHRRLHLRLARQPHVNGRAHKEVDGQQFDVLLSHRAGRLRFLLRPLFLHPAVARTPRCRPTTRPPGRVHRYPSITRICSPTCIRPRSRSRSRRPGWRSRSPSIGTSWSAIRSAPNATARWRKHVASSSPSSSRASPSTCPSSSSIARWPSTARSCRRPARPRSSAST